MRSWEGVFIPITTPFRGDDVAVDGLAANIERWNQTGLAGYVVLGSTGEFPMLSEAERERVLAAARAAIPREKTFIAGAGADSAPHTIRQPRRPPHLGADPPPDITPHPSAQARSQPAAPPPHHLAVGAQPTLP